MLKLFGFSMTRFNTVGFSLLLNKSFLTSENSITYVIDVADFKYHHKNFLKDDLGWMIDLLKGFSLFLIMPSYAHVRNLHSPKEN